LVTQTEDIDLSPETGWSTLEQLETLNPTRSFVSSEPDGDRLRVCFYQRDTDGVIVGKVWFGPGAEGPPGCAHGGSMAAVLDEAMGAAAWLAGHSALAVEIKVSYRNMLPLGTVASLEAWVERVDGRKVTCQGRLIGPGGELFAECEGLFLEIELERFGERIKQAFEALRPTQQAPRSDDEVR